MTTELTELLEQFERPDQPYTDSSNAWLLAQLEGDRIRYVHAWNKWLVWSENHWKVDGGKALVDEAAKTVPRHLSQQWAEQQYGRHGQH